MSGRSAWWSWRRQAWISRKAWGALEAIPDSLMLAALLARAALVIAPDTGALHLADLLGVPTIGLYGSTAPRRLQLAQCPPPHAVPQRVHLPPLPRIPVPGTPLPPRAVTCRSFPCRRRCFAL